ncbi:probable transcriptional regulator [Oceanicaulis alexandrii HTCC2633]|jgi:DNA-binding transcriptional LysR family regulator|uniref:LysR family transcriptional regulator n=1 Tax=Oceanicaulis sp. HTCC2633 TaxID=314254 RepID=UPI000066A2DD|nr:LysR family transcriptional regulator [Oceanicaulis sp. HTCC2633]EAP88644.1 probable transcriptional regulator [Oceanicaulis alexandrii HTCC2633] [Oceanicaulis sp. HTCC2633]
MDRLSTLEIFRKVVDRNGFSAAARDLGLSNASVSKAIKELEAQLGAQLIVRTTRSLHLTDVGQAYYQRVGGVLDALDDADELVRSETASPRGRLRLAAPLSLGLVALQEALLSFCKTYPDILLDLHMSDAVVDVVGEGFDAAIRGGNLPDSSLKARKLMSLDRVVVASPDYLARSVELKRPEDLSRHDALIYSGAEHSETCILKRDGEAVQVQLRPRLRVNSSIAVKSAAVEGLGIAVTPHVYVRQALEEGALVQLLPDWSIEGRALYVVYPEQREVSRKLRVLLDHLAETFRER